MESAHPEMYPKGDPITPGERAAVAALVDALGRHAWAAVRLREVVVFGSRARGKARVDSDLDLAVRISGARDPGVEADIYDAAVEVRLATDIPLSPLVRFDSEAENPGLARSVSRDGIVLWSRAA